MKNKTITFIEPIMPSNLMLAIFSCLIFVSDTLNANSDCSSSFMGFSSSEQEKDYTRHFLAYLSHLFEEGTIDLPSLENFMHQLKLGKLVNPISEMDAKTNPIRLVAFNAIQADFESTYLLPTEILIWLHKFITHKKLEEDLKNQAVTSTNNTIFPITFNKLKINESTYIEVMSAPVTEYQWANVMEEFHLKSVPSEAQEYIHINGKDYFIRTNHPMLDRSFWDALRFANKLSLQHGYYPTYNFDLLYRTIEEGKLRCLSGNLIINRQETYPQRSSGYRLPTPQELYILAQKKFEYLLQQDKHELDLFFENINARIKESHPVNFFRPVFIQKQKFMDILATNSEWAIESKMIHKLENQPVIGILIVENDGNLEVKPYQLKEHPNNPYNKPILFRLVRSISKEEYERDSP